MKLELRPLRAADFDECLSLVEDGFAYDRAQLGALPKFWGDIIDRGLGVAHAFMDPDEPGRIAAFGIAHYVDSQTANTIAAYEAPFVARTMLDRWRAGATPFRVEDDVACDNAGSGVHIFVSHIGYPKRLTSAETAALMLNLFEGFVTGVRGLNIRTVLQEVFGLSAELAMGMVGSSGELKRARDNWRYEPKPPPFLCIVRRERAANPVDFFSLTFFGNVEPPRLNLARPQRDLLRTALIRDNDSWIAAMLDVSLSTIKKRWQSIFDTVSENRPDGYPEETNLTEGKRGAEKRGYVLQYLRQHPEELHPYKRDRNSDLNHG